MKRFLWLILLTICLVSCDYRTREEKQLDEIVNVLKSNNKFKDINRESLIVTDSLLSCPEDSVRLQYAKTINYAATKQQSLIDSFKNLLPAGIDRIWKKTLSDEQKRALAAYELSLTSLGNQLINIPRSSKTSLKDKESVYVVKFSSNDTTQSDSYVGVFYFISKDNSYEVISYLLFAEKEISMIENICKYAERVTSPKWIPTLESNGIDVVPEDEDPTKTRAEREKLKELQREREELERKRKEEIAQRQKNQKNDTYFKKVIREYASLSNRSAPYKIDDLTICERTTFQGGVLENHMIIITQKEELSSSQWERVKSELRSNLRESCQDLFDSWADASEGRSRYDVKESLERIGFKFQNVYRDCNGKYLFTTSVSAQEL